MRIAYVEDNPANLALVERVAGMNRHLIVSYNEGEVAMKELIHERFDLILMDVELAGEVGGLDVVRSLRKSGLKTPIVAVTAYAMMGDRDKCLEAGCDDYLPKPLPIVELVALFDRYDEITRHKVAEATPAVAVPAVVASVQPVPVAPVAEPAAAKPPLTPAVPAAPQAVPASTPARPIEPVVPAPAASVPTPTPVPESPMPPTAAPASPVPAASVVPTVAASPAEPVKEPESVAKTDGPSSTLTPVSAQATATQPTTQSVPTNDNAKEPVKSVAQEKPQEDTPVQATTSAPENGQHKEPLN